MHNAAQYTLASLGRRASSASKTLCWRSLSSPLPSKVSHHPVAGRGHRVVPHTDGFEVPSRCLDLGVLRRSTFHVVVGAFVSRIM